MRYNGLKRDRFAVFGAAAGENMLKQLKFDFYKILKSRALFVVWILMLLFCLVNPVMAIVQKSTDDVYSQLQASGAMIPVSIIFSVLLSAKDLSSGYIKNIYSFTNKLCYIVSKVVYIFSCCLIYALGEILFAVIGNYCFGSGVFYDASRYSLGEIFPLGYFIADYMLEILNCTAIGVVCCFLCMLLKKEYIVLIIMLLYLFLGSSSLYAVINNLAGADFYIEPYTLFGFSMNGGVTSISDNLFWETILPGVIVPVCYILVFGFFSWLILKKRNV